MAFSCCRTPVSAQRRRSGQFPSPHSPQAQIPDEEVTLTTFVLTPDWTPGVHNHIFCGKNTALMKPVRSSDPEGDLPLQVRTQAQNTDTLRRVSETLCKVNSIHLLGLAQSSIQPDERNTVRVLLEIRTKKMAGLCNEEEKIGQQLSSALVPEDVRPSVVWGNCIRLPLQNLDKDYVLGDTETVSASSPGRETGVVSTVFIPSYRWHNPGIKSDDISYRSTVLMLPLINKSRVNLLQEIKGVLKQGDFMGNFAKQLSEKFHGLILLGLTEDADIVVLMVVHEDQVKDVVPLRLNIISDMINIVPETLRQQVDWGDLLPIPVRYRSIRLRKTTDRKFRLENQWVPYSPYEKTPKPITIIMIEVQRSVESDVFSMDQSQSQKQTLIDQVTRECSGLQLVAVSKETCHDCLQKDCACGRDDVLRKTHLLFKVESDNVSTVLNQKENIQQKILQLARTPESARVQWGPLVCLPVKVWAGGKNALEDGPEVNSITVYLDINWVSIDIELFILREDESRLLLMELRSSGGKDVELLKDILSNLKNEALQLGVVRTLHEDLHLRLLGVTSVRRTLQFLLEVDQEWVWEALRRKDDVIRELTGLVPGAHLQDVQWGSFLHLPLFLAPLPQGASGSGSRGSHGGTPQRTTPHK